MAMNDLNQASVAAMHAAHNQSLTVSQRFPTFTYNTAATTRLGIPLQLPPASSYSVVVSKPTGPEHPFDWLRRRVDEIRSEPMGWAA